MNRERAVEVVAGICHEANRAVCEAFGDHSQPPWSEAPEWQHDSAVNGVRTALANPEGTPEGQYEAWCAEKERGGWTWGPVKDADRKTHPCLVPYAELPPEQRVKDGVFLSVVRACAPLLALAEEDEEALDLLEWFVWKCETAQARSRVTQAAYREFLVRVGRVEEGRGAGIPERVKDARYR